MNTEPDILKEGIDKIAAHDNFQKLEKEEVQGVEYWAITFQSKERDKDGFWMWHGSKSPNRFFKHYILKK